MLLRVISDDKTRHPCYSIAASHADDMAVHLYGALPVKILNRVRPREAPEVKAYRLQSYETVTKSTADKALSIVSKIGNPSLYQIRFNEGVENAEKLEEYALEKYPECNSVVNFVFEVGLRKMMADPNSIYVIKPRVYPVTDLQRVEPMIKIYGSKNIWYKDQDCFVVFIRKEEPPENTNAPVKSNYQVYYLEYYDSAQIIEFYCYTTNSRDLNIQETQNYKHSFAEIPCWEMGGSTEVQDDGTEVYKSFFDPAVAFWNKAINHESDLDGAYINHMHPIRIEVAEECDYVYKPWGQRCNVGNILNPADGQTMSCPSCLGSGYRSVKSPFGVYKIDREKLDGQTNASISPVSFATVPVEPTKMLEERIEHLLEKGLYALNMDVVNKIGANQSGVAKVIDRGELYDFLYKISSVIFDTHITNIFKFFNLYMFGIESVNPGTDPLKSSMPMISKPVIFDISSSQEMIADYKNARESGVSPYYLRVKQMKINSKEFASDEDLQCYLNLILKCDPLPDIPTDTIIALASEGWYRTYDPIIHVNIGSFIRRAMEEFPENPNVEGSGFEDMADDKQYETLVKYAKEVEKENKVTITPMIPGQLDAQGKPLQAVDNNASPIANQQAIKSAVDKLATTRIARGVV